MTANLAGIIGIEALAAAQGFDFRAPLKTSASAGGACARLAARPRCRTSTTTAISQPDMRGRAPSSCAAGALDRGAPARSHLPGVSRGGADDRRVEVLTSIARLRAVILGLPHTGTDVPPISRRG